MANRDITAKDVLALLVEKHQDAGRRYVCAAEVSNSTGAYAMRRLDFVAVDCWPSSGIMISAFEIKISKSDFRRELENPTKHNIFFDDIDSYSIVAPDYVLDDMSIIPKKWGVYHVVRDEKGVLALKTVRKPLALHDDKADERKIDRGFMASLVRAIDNQSTTKAVLHKERQALKEKIREETEMEMANGRVVSTYDYEELQRLRKICRELDIPTWYRDMSDFQKEQFRQAQAVAEHIYILERSFNQVESNLRSARRCAKELLKCSEKDGGKAAEVLKGMADGMQLHEKLSPSDVAATPDDPYDGMFGAGGR